MIANGIEISSVVMLKASSRLGEIPVMNMWWAHTVKLKMLAMTEEPKHVVPQERTTLRRGEEDRAERSVGDQEAQRRDERREGPQHEQAREDPGPREEGQPHE